MPEAAEVELWIETIIRLWDDAGHYQDASERAVAHAGQWRPERLAPDYERFFRDLCPQPAAPLIPHHSESDSEN
jgi:hypothetical protein